MIRTSGLTHLHLAVRDVRKSLKFYSDVFGMQVQFWVGEGMVFLNTPDSGDTLTLRQAGQDEPVGPGGGVGHFGFRLQNKNELEKAIQEVVAGGGSLMEQGEHQPGVPYAYVTDVDGYVVELG